MMHGPQILVSSLSTTEILDKFGHIWQYHPRSDRHSKLASWVIAFDLLNSSDLLKSHALTGKVVIGINCQIVDFGTQRSKNLDLVIGRPDGTPARNTFSGLATEYGIELSAAARRDLEPLSDVPVSGISQVLVAVEAKAAMTSQVKALPRLYDELNSSHLCVHGASKQSLAIGFVMVNCSDQFISPDMNKYSFLEHLPSLSMSKQPHALERTLGKLREIPRRSNVTESGFDGLGIVVVRAINDGSPFELAKESPAPQPGEGFYYDSMITRVANEYDTTFQMI